MGGLVQGRQQASAMVCQGHVREETGRSGGQDVTNWFLAH